MRCLAIWGESSNQGMNGILDIDELHINLWKLKRKNNKYNPLADSYDHFLDIGIMFATNPSISSINIYLQANIASSNIIDIGSKFKKREIVTSIFNENYCPHLNGNKYVDIIDRRSSSEKVFTVYFLDVQSDITLCHEYNGTIIKVKVPKIAEGTNLHLRIRIVSESIRKFGYIYKPRNSILESAFINTEIVDFRVNESRILDSSLLELIDNNYKVNIKQVKYFLVREACCNLIFSHKPLNGSRHLETNLWDEFVGTNYDLKRMLAYYWKTEGQQTSYNALAKFSFEENNWKTISIFLVIILLIGIASGVGGNFLTKFIEAQAKTSVETSSENSR